MTRQIFIFFYLIFRLFPHDCSFFFLFLLFPCFFFSETLENSVRRVALQICWNICQFNYYVLFLCSFSFSFSPFLFFFSETLENHGASRGTADLLEYFVLQFGTLKPDFANAVYSAVFQVHAHCVALCCSVLQRVAACCSVLRCPNLGR